MTYSIHKTILLTVLLTCGAIPSGWSVAQEIEDNKNEHPLVSVIKMATTELRRAEREIDEYSCLLIKRERIDGKLQPREYMQAKVRHRDVDQGVPLSIYLKFLKPSSVVGREVLYVEGERGGDLIARRGGTRLPNLTVELSPTGRYAMKDNRHPVTEFGFLNLVNRLIESMQEDLQYDDVEVKYYDNARIGDRECRHIQVTHTEKQPHFDYSLARIFIDKDLGVPVYFASYGWPSEPGEKPLLTEEYIFTKIKLNPGFSDVEFQSTNPDYAFEEPRTPAALVQVSSASQVALAP